MALSYKRVLGAYRYKDLRFLLLAAWWNVFIFSHFHIFIYYILYFIFLYIFLHLVAWWTVLVVRSCFEKRK